MQKKKHGRPTIGVLVGWHFYQHTLPHGYLEPIFRGIQLAARQRNCNLLFACGMSQQVAQVRPAWPVPMPDTDFVPVGPWNTDGLIVMAALNSEPRSNYMQALIAAGHPVVFVAPGENGPTVAADNESGIFEALEHLREHGHRRIAFIAGIEGDPGDSEHRLRAYQSSVHRLGLETDARLITYGRLTVEGGREAMQSILDSGVAFTAALACNDNSALGAMQALRQAGRRIPQDIAVIGFDDQLDAKVQQPPLTSIHQPTFEIGYRSLLLLLDCLAGKSTGAETLKVPTRLIIRRSCGCQMYSPSSPSSFSSLSSHKGTEGIEGTQGTQTRLSAPEALAQATTEAVIAEAQHLSLDEIQELCGKMISAFAASLEQGEALRFHSTLTEILQQTERANEDAHLWQAAISTLRSGMSPLLENQPESHRRALAEEILDHARLTISEYMQRQHTHYLVQATNLTDQLGLMTSRLLVAPDETQILETLREHLPEVGLRHTQVAFYEAEGDDPVAGCTLPFRAEAEADGLQARKPHHFPSRAFPPPGLYPEEEPFNLALLPLTIQEKLSGFVAFDAAHLEPCAAIVQELATALKSARLYREAIQGRQLAEEANQMKSRFLSTVSHELRTPLNLIVGLSEVLLREPTPEEPSLPELYRQDVERIQANSQHLSRLIRDVLDLASSEAGQLKLTPEPLDLAEVLAVVALTGEQLAHEKGLSWQAELPARLPPVWGDRTRLRQVALNLVSNAIKFTAEGQITLKVEVAEKQVLISVSDTGLGISPEEQSLIFDEFRQSGRTTARGYGGMGLGLAICKRLVELHQGEIGVHSSGIEGDGSTFYFTLPTLGQILAQPQAGKTPGQPQRVLVLTEKAESGEQLCEHLRREGFEVEKQWVSTETGAWLPEVLASPPGAIVLDLRLASEQGWEILKVLKGQTATQNIPVLFYSLTQEHDRGSLLEMNYLTKPLAPNALTEALAKQGLLAEEEAREKTILIVDDEPETLKMNARIVRTQLPNCHILQARNGQEALDILQKERPDLMLLDLMMPEVDGFKVLETMRTGNDPREIPVIVLTAQLLTEADMARLNRGVVTVLEKGLFSLEETLAHIQAALARNRDLGSKTQRLVRKAMAYLHEHYAEPVSRESLARYVGASEGHLARCFRQETGMTPMVYLNRYRVNRAKAFLTDKDLSITEIALAVGFPDGAYFSHVFRREVGISPNAYRRGRRMKDEL